MFCCPECTGKAIPEEYRHVAEALFPSGKSAGAPVLKNVKAYADILGIKTDYAKCLGVHKNGAEFAVLLSSFQNNMDLLIQKTWVEKAEENRKENLQDRLPLFVASMEQGNYRRAIEEFGVILEELAYLFFGPQSCKSDFTEYTFRIDIQMGLFWWYGSKLGSNEGLEWAKSADDELLLAVLLLGICYLVNF